MTDDEIRTPDEEFALAVADPLLTLDSLAEGRHLKFEYIEHFGSWFHEEFRPLLRRVHLAGGEPQLLVNDLAALMHNVADSIFFDVAADDEDDDADEDEDD